MPRRLTENELQLVSGGFGSNNYGDYGYGDYGYGDYGYGDYGYGLEANVTYGNPGGS